MSDATPPPPLARLFAIAYRSLIDGLHAELSERGWTDVRRSFGPVLLATRSQATTATELAELLGTTKQATSKLVDAMEDAGYVARRSGADARQKLVELTPRGAELLDAVEDIYRDLEAEWAAIVGADEVERIRSALVAVMTHGGDGRLPEVRPPG